MDLEVEELPSGDINANNFVDRANECEGYLNNAQWGQFLYLFKLLYKFFKANQGKIPEQDENIYHVLRQNGINIVLKNLELATVFEDFKEWLARLSEVVQDKEQLWNIIHTQAQMSIRVTMKQNQEIASLFFSPEKLFEFGVKPFMQSNVCDWKNQSEEVLVDNFYGVAGFVRACGLSTTFEANNTEYHDFVKRILVSFIQLPDYDPHRFVWLVEACNGNLRIPSAKFNEMVQEVLDIVSKQDFEGELLQKLYKFCVMSTSPLMQSFPVIQQHIDETFAALIEGQRTFCRRYIFACFSSIDWSGPSSPNLCEQVKCWQLFVTNTVFRLKDRPELPQALLADLLDDSMCFFEAFFADAQPTKEKAPEMRMDIFAVAETVQENYPGRIKDATLHRVWYILFIAAITNALEHELKDIKYIDPSKDNCCLLGLDHGPTDFSSSKLALAVLGKKFEPDEETFQKMISFIRQNMK